jgi:hypothetical protein
VAGVTLASADDLGAVAREMNAMLVGPHIDPQWAPHARAAMRLPRTPQVDLAGWEPDYGRKAEAQSRWEAAHGRSLGA